jgi:predicted transcriptional regulator
MSQAIKTKRLAYGTGEYVTARVSKPEKQALDRIAARERRTISQVARFAIQQFLATRKMEPASD